MAALENIFIAICIGGMIVVTVATFATIVAVLIGLAVKLFKCWREEDGK